MTSDNDLKRAREWWNRWMANDADDDDQPALESLAALLAAEREPLEKALREIHEILNRGPHTADHGWKLNAQCAIDSILDLKKQVADLETEVRFLEETQPALTKAAARKAAIEECAGYIYGRLRLALGEDMATDLCTGIRALLATEGK